MHIPLQVHLRRHIKMMTDWHSPPSCLASYGRQIALTQVGDDKHRLQRDSHTHTLCAVTMIAVPLNESRLHSPTRTFIHLQTSQTALLYHTHSIHHRCTPPIWVYLGPCLARSALVRDQLPLFASQLKRDLPSISLSPCQPFIKSFNPSTIYLFQNVPHLDPPSQPGGFTAWSQHLPAACRRWTPRCTCHYSSPSWPPFFLHSPTATHVQGKVVGLNSQIFGRSLTIQFGLMNHPTEKKMRGAGIQDRVKPWEWVQSRAWKWCFKQSSPPGTQSGLWMEPLQWITMYFWKRVPPYSGPHTVCSSCHHVLH